MLLVVVGTSEVPHRLTGGGMTLAMEAQKAQDTIDTIDAKC